MGWSAVRILWSDSSKKGNKLGLSRAKLSANWPLTALQIAAYSNGYQVGGLLSYLPIKSQLSIPLCFATYKVSYLASKLLGSLLFIHIWSNFMTMHIDLKICHSLQSVVSITEGQKNNYEEIWHPQFCPMSGQYFRITFVLLGVQKS